MRGGCWVEIIDGRIVRIFKNRKSAVVSPAWDERRVEECPRKNAVTAIRNNIFDLSDGFCKYCGKYEPWSSGHMHEEIHRGEGGEISIYNSVWSCFTCHTNQHPEKTLRFGEHGL